jgi:hypothetical protein
MISRQTVAESVYYVEYTRPTAIPLRTKGNKTGQSEELSAGVEQTLVPHDPGDLEMIAETETEFRAELSGQFPIDSVFPGTEETYDLFGVEGDGINFSFLCEAIPAMLVIRQRLRSLGVYGELARPRFARSTPNRR